MINKNLIVELNNRCQDYIEKNRKETGHNIGELSKTNRAYIQGFIHSFQYVNQAEKLIKSKLNEIKGFDAIDKEQIEYICDLMQAVEEALMDSECEREIENMIEITNFIKWGSGK